MTVLQTENLDLLLLEDTLWVLNKTIRAPSYDFDLQAYFHCQHPEELPESYAFSSIDHQPVSSEELERELALMQAGWEFFDRQRFRVSAELRKGPQGMKTR